MAKAKKSNPEPSAEVVGAAGQVIDLNREYVLGKDEKGERRKPMPYDPGPLYSRDTSHYQPGGEEYTFLATARRLAVVLRDGRVVMFENSIFRTTDEELAKALREADGFETFFFEDAYPDWYIEERKRHAEYISADPEAIEPGYFG
jgi:hypothetical protein